MKTNLYVITDTKANRTTEPFACPTDSVAIRNFLFGCFASETPPQDCLLWRIASFCVDDEDAVLFKFIDTMADNSAHVINVPIETIEAYAKAYAMLSPQDKDTAEFEDFTNKGVIA